MSAGASGAERPRAELDALRQVRESTRALLEQGRGDEAWELVLSALEALLVRNRDLELLLAKLRRERIGRKSEQLDERQLQLLFEALVAQGGPEAEVDPEAESREDAQLDKELEQAEKDKTATKDQRKRGPRWKTRGVDRQVHPVAVAEAERICTGCGQPMGKIGVDVSRRLEFVPARFVEHEYHRDKYACRKCKEGVTTAPGPDTVLEGSAAGASLLAHVVVSKFADHTPLHRLRRIYARSGAEIPVSTLSDWVAGAGELLAPLVEQLMKRVLGAYIVRTDATGLPVLDPDSPENIVRGTIWALIGDDRDVVFRYTPTGEGATGPWGFLAGHKGRIQADASNVFDRLFDGQAARAIELGCWAHGRRRLVSLRDTDCRVAYPLKLIARLYRIEDLADARELGPVERIQLRRERSMPVLDKLKRWFVTTRASETPSSELAQAAGYALNHWEALTRFVDDGRVSLDNNLCEQQLRDIALGRKNYLFAGSHEAARRTAHLYSLTRTCAQYGVAPLPYFTDVLGKLGNGWPVERLDELLPHRWPPAAAQPESANGP